MLAYIFRRLLLIVPTLIGIMVLNFTIIQFAPGGPVEQMIAQIEGRAGDAAGRISGNTGSEVIGASSAAADNSGSAGGSSTYRGSQGLDPEFIAEIERMFGFDKPLHERFLLMMRNYLTFDFGESYFRDRAVVDLVVEKLPVSISLGVWSTLIVYLIAIPLGITKAVRDGSRFDVWTSGVIVVGNAVPGFLFAIVLVILFAGGRFFDWFPLRGLQSDVFLGTSVSECVVSASCIVDYLWHLVLPVIAMVIGAFAGLAMLTKNSFLDQIRMQYVTTARAKGLSEARVLYGHVFRNGMLIVIAGFPAAFIGMLFTSSLLIEIIFSLDGLGRLGFEAVINRDYPIVFATLYIFTLMGLVMNLVTDITYTLIDPRIDFERREG